MWRYFSRVASFCVVVLVESEPSVRGRTASRLPLTKKTQEEEDQREDLMRTRTTRRVLPDKLRCCGAPFLIDS